MPGSFLSSTTVSTLLALWRTPQVGLALLQALSLKQFHPSHSFCSHLPLHFLFFPQCTSIIPLNITDIDCRLVEQTTRGIIKIQDSPTLAAVASRHALINVAELPPKRTLEPPYVAEAVVLACIAECRIELDSACLVLGYGAIGRAVVSWLLQAGIFLLHAMAVWDSLPDAREAAERNGLRLWDRDVPAMPIFSHVVGCAGRPSFSPRDAAWLLDGATLMPAAAPRSFHSTIFVSRRCHLGSSFFSIPLRCKDRYTLLWGSPLALETGSLLLMEGFPSLSVEG